MSGLRRFASATLLVGIAVLGVAERAALHAHPLEENDLVPHQLVIVPAGAACAAGAHLDAATLADHPVCPECVLAAAGNSLTPSAVASLADAAEAGRLVADRDPGSASACASDPGARGPPAT